MNDLFRAAYARTVKLADSGHAVNAEALTVARAFLAAHPPAAPAPSGPWWVSADGRVIRNALHDADVSLEVRGEWITNDERRRWAQTIADVLNMGDHLRPCRPPCSDDDQPCKVSRDGMCEVRA